VNEPYDSWLSLLRAARGFAFWGGRTNCQGGPSDQCPSAGENDSTGPQAVPVASYVRLAGGTCLLVHDVDGWREVVSWARGAVGVLDPTAHPGLPLKVFLGVGRCQRL
jgi:hypothetical protein